MFSKIEKAYQDFCAERFALPTAAELAECLITHQLKFPEIYVSYLAQFNGGWFTEPTLPRLDLTTGDRLNVMYGNKVVMESAELISPLNVSLYEHEFDRNYFPIGYTLMGGMLVVGMPAEVSDVVFLKPASVDRLFFMAHDIEAFFAGLKPNSINHGR